MKRVTVSTVGILANTGMLWLATAIAALAWWPIYEDAHFVILVAVALAAGSLIAILGALFRWSAAILSLAGVGAFLVLGVPVAVPDTAILTVFPSLNGIVQLIVGTATSWKQLITITLPVATYQALLVPPFLLILLATIAGLSVALRSPRGDLAALAPAAFFLFGIAFGPKTVAYPFVEALALLAVTLLWLMWRHWYVRRAAVRLIAGKNKNQGLLGIRTVLSAFLVIAIAGGAGVAASAALPPAGARDVLRSTVQQPFDPREYVSPLVGFRRYLKSDEANSIMFTMTGLPNDARIRVAALDSYNGIVYSLGSSTVTGGSGSFTRVPYRFDQSGVNGTQVSTTVTIGDYRGVWVPTIGQLESVHFDGQRSTSLQDSFFYNNNAGTAAVVAGVKSGDQYALDSVIPAQPSLTELASLTPGNAELPQLGTLPDDVRTVLDSYTRSVSGQGNKLVAMLDGIKANGYISHGLSASEPPSRSGHSADRITQLLTDPRMIGDAEQYAVTAALMARELGWPARVVFGFVPGNSSKATTAITGDMVSAWIEVSTAKYGWVTIDPNPPVRDIPEQQPQKPRVVSRPQSIVQPPPAEEPNRNLQTPTETTQNATDQIAPWLVVVLSVVRVVGWVALVLGVALSPFFVIVAAKVRRRVLRKRAPHPVQRITGGWREYEDAVLDHGFNPPPAATRTEVAGTVGGEAPLALATIADRAIFSPFAPDSTEADAVWNAVTELEAALDAERTRWQRIRALISVRSLGGYSVKNLFKR